MYDSATQCFITKTRKCFCDWSIIFSSDISTESVVAAVLQLKSITDDKGIIALQDSLQWYRELKHSQVGAAYHSPGQLAASDGSLLPSGKAGAGCAFASGQRWHGSVPGQQSVFRGEMIGLAKCVDIADPDQPLTVLVDSQAVLNVVEAGIRHLGRLEPAFHDDEDLIHLLITAIHNRTEKTCLVKIKSHCGDPLNDAADEEAKQGATTPDSSTSDHGSSGRFRFAEQQKALQLEGELKFSAMTGHFKARVSRKFSGLKFQGGKTFASRFLENAELGREYFRDQLTDVLPTSTVRRTLQVIGGTFPSQSNLYKWGLVAGPQCLICNARHEGFTHIQCWCPELKEIRIATHHKIWKRLIGFFQEYSNGLQFFAEQVIGCLGDMKVNFQTRELKDEWTSAC